eukprot:SAG31_NODE_1637_length_7679_cov_5.133509_2_plen_93_part_00
MVLALRWMVLALEEETVGLTGRKRLGDKKLSQGDKSTQSEDLTDQIHNMTKRNCESHAYLCRGDLERSPVCTSQRNHTSHGSSACIESHGIL